MKLPSDKWNNCPIRYCAEIFGDKWVLVILRDLIFRGKNNFKSLLESSEGIASNILTDRLKKMEAHGLVKHIVNKKDAREKIYQLTDKGWDLLPVMLSFFEWSYKYDQKTYLTSSIMDSFNNDIDSLKTSFRNGKVLILSEKEA